MPLTRMRSSTLEKGPLRSRSSTMVAAVDGPTPGSTSSSSAVAVLMLISPNEAEPDEPEAPCSEVESSDACCASPCAGMWTLEPSTTAAARLTPLVSAPSVSPPAAWTASLTRGRAMVSSYTPGATTAPSTCTRTTLVSAVEAVVVGEEPHSPPVSAAEPSPEPEAAVSPLTASPDRSTTMPAPSFETNTNTPIPRSNTVATATTASHLRLPLPRPFRNTCAKPTTSPTNGGRHGQPQGTESKKPPARTNANQTRI